MIIIPSKIHFNQKKKCKKQKNSKKKIQKIILFFFCRVVEEDVLPFDHIYPNSQESSSTVFHYNQLGSESFKQFHRNLKALAENGKIRYVYRHNPPTSNKKVVLQGFGVEMDLKSTEYKVIDDRIKTDSSEEKKVSEKQKIVPLAKEDLQTIGVKTVQYILSSSNPIEALQNVSQNFPYLSNDISNLELDHNVLSKVKKTHMVVGSGSSIILINGRHVHVENIDIFT